MFLVLKKVKLTDLQATGAACPGESTIISPSTNRVIPIVTILPSLQGWTSYKTQLFAKKAIIECFTLKSTSAILAAPDIWPN